MSTPTITWKTQHSIARVGPYTLEVGVEEATPAERKQGFFDTWYWDLYIKEPRKPGVNHLSGGRVNDTDGYGLGRACNAVAKAMTTHQRKVAKAKKARKAK